MRKSRSGFPVLAQSIVSQQLSVKAAATILGLYLAHAPGRKKEVSAGTPISATVNRFRAGLSRPKASYMIGLAEAVASGELSFRSIARLADDKALEKLTEVKGIGPRTAEMYLMFSLNRPDIFPIGDGGIRAAMCRHYEIERDDYPTAAPEIAEAWRPYRSIACRYLWAHKDNTPVKSEVTLHRPARIHIFGFIGTATGFFDYSIAGRPWKGKTHYAIQAQRKQIHNRMARYTDKMVIAKGGVNVVRTIVEGEGSNIPQCGI